MARILPWMKQNGSAKLAEETGRPNKRRKTQQPDSDTTAGPTSKPRALRTVQRTPSTSPPPRPPSQHKMRPGWDADDIYIMVEDEFLATAQLFTKHLHHAEYVHLKKEARNRSAEAIKQITRPVDMKTTIREETRKKEAESRSDRVKIGLEKLGITKVPNNADSPESETDLDKADDPWQGTHLQRLMTVSPKKAAKSLTGLHGPSSATRAAAGHQRQKRRNQISRDGSQVQPAGAGAMRAGHTAAGVLESEEEEDDDDLDGPPAAHRTRTSAHVKGHNQERRQERSSPSTTSLRHDVRTGTAPKRSFLDLSPLPNSISKAKAQFDTSLHDSSASKISPESSDLSFLPTTLKSDLVCKRLEERKKTQERIKQEATDASNAVALTNEIPLFLA